ncbi:MAG: aldehyde ferredoxin oxidoreductase C-terminal domain-containing protein [Bacillota bacterium]
MGSILRVNTRTHVITSADNEADPLLAGRGLTSTIVCKEVIPTCEALGRFNKLVIAPALLAGSTAVNANRVSIGAKSPLTGGIKESNVGGSLATALSSHGMNALVIEGVPEDSSWWVLEISDEGIRFVPADDLAGLGNYATVERIHSRYGDEVAVMCIGPAGEMGMFAATIAVTDMERRPSRHAGRGGLGAVMGSKRLKAIVVRRGSRKPPQPKRPELFRNLVGEWARKLAEEKRSLALYGNAQIVDTAAAVGALPTRNFRSGRFEHASEINGAAMARIQKVRGGRMGHRCSPGCVIRCSNVYHGPDGNYLTSGLEYESIGMLGSNLSIGNLDDIAGIERKCDDYGLDTIEIGAAIGVAMEAGIVSFGDVPGVLDLLDQIAKGTILGRVLGNGAAITGKVLGVRRVPVVKGQSLASFDPRAMKGTGVTYATSPMGADHTAGNAMPGRRGLDPQQPDVLPHLPKGQVELSRDLQIMAAILDCYMCIYVGYVRETVEKLAGLLSAYLGTQVTPDDLVNLGRRILKVERDFNVAAGIAPGADRLPEFFYTEPLEPDGYVFDVPDNEIDRFYDF